MRRFLLLILSFFLISSFLPLSPVKAVVAVEDQFCDDANITAADDWWYINSHTLSQTFTPTKNRLTSVLLAIAGGADINAVITAQIWKVTGGETLVSSATATTEHALVSWVEFTYPAVTLDTTKEYRIKVTTPSNTATWVISQAPAVPCYSNGAAVVDGSPRTDPVQDFGFVTYGYDVTPPAPVIQPPTAATGRFDESTKDVTISWTKSTTAGIDGYYVYRSTVKTSGYTKIATVSPSLDEYVDTTNLTENKSYYYCIKAYDGTILSVSSNIVTVAIPVVVVDDQADDDLVADDNVVMDTDDDDGLVADDNVVTDTGDDDASTEKTLGEKLFTDYLYFSIGVILVLISLIVIIVLLIVKKKPSTPEIVKAEPIVEEPVKVEEVKKEEVEK